MHLLTLLILEMNDEVLEHSEGIKYLHIDNSSSIGDLETQTMNYLASQSFSNAKILTFGPGGFACATRNSLEIVQQSFKPAQLLSSKYWKTIYVRTNESGGRSKQ